MNIWLSTIGQRLDDAESTRTMLLASALIKRNHRVTLWTSAFDHIRKQWRPEWRESNGLPIAMESGLRVCFMKGCGYRGNVSVRRFLDHKLAARDLWRQASSQNTPDIAVASLPDHISAATMVALGQDRRFPVIIDVRDKWPHIFVDYAPAPLKPFVRAFLTREITKTRWALSNADNIVSMMQSLIDWSHDFAERRNPEQDKVFFLATTKETSAALCPEEDVPPMVRNLLTSREKPFIFSFIGTFNKTQHPTLILDAVDLIKNDPAFVSEKAAVIIGGDGVDGESVRKRTEKTPNVFYLGWLRPHQIRAVLTRSDIGLLPMNFSSEAFNNKAFSYLAAGLPIINCAVGDLRALIETEAIGTNISAGNPRALADAMLYHLKNQRVTEKMKSNTRILYSNRFDQDRVYDDYARHIEDVAKAARRE